MSSARNVGESAIRPVCAQPSAEIVRVERAKCRRECDLAGVRATLCGDLACRVREMQARVRCVLCARNPLRRFRGSVPSRCGRSERGGGSGEGRSVQLCLQSVFVQLGGCFWYPRKFPYRKRCGRMWRTVLGRLGEEQQPQLHRCLHHPDLLRVDALDPDQAGKDPAAQLGKDPEWR